MNRITIKWLRQAEADFLASKDSLEKSHYEWACFQSQQSAEKALKACLYEKGYTSIITHSLRELIKECSRISASFVEVSKEAKDLDMFYIPTRYPNGLAGDLAPSEFYEKEDALRCIHCAESILNAARTFLKN